MTGSHDDAQDARAAQAAAARAVLADQLEAERLDLTYRHHVPASPSTPRSSASIATAVSGRLATSEGVVDVAVDPLPVTAARRAELARAARPTPRPASVTEAVS